MKEADKQGLEGWEKLGQLRGCVYRSLEFGALQESMILEEADSETGALTDSAVS
jgi:hypothetical protein